MMYYTRNVNARAIDILVRTCLLARPVRVKIFVLLLYNFETERKKPCLSDILVRVQAA